jgi:hypothetical protein
MGMPKVDGHAYEKQQVQGHTLNNRTVAMLTEVESRLGYDLTVLQGSYNAGGVSQSAGTHDGGGAVDLAPYDWKDKVAALRRVGFAAWHRPAIPGTWGEHIHAIAYGDRDLSPAAAAQIADYQNHLDGLAGSNYDTQTPHPKLSDFDYQAFRQSQRQSELRAQRRRAAFKHAVASLVRLRKLTDDKADRKHVQNTIASLRKH